MTFNLHTGDECHVRLDASTWSLRGATAGCDSFGSLTMKILTAATTSIQADMAFVAGVEVEGQRLDSRLLYTVIGRYNRYGL